MDEWKTSKDWAEQLGLSVTGFARRVKRGKFEKKGRLYRAVAEDALVHSRRTSPPRAFDVIEYLADVACSEFNEIELRYMSEGAQAKWRRVAAHTLAAAESLR